MIKRKRRWPLWLFLTILTVGGALFYRSARVKQQGASVDPSLVTTVQRGDLEVAVIEMGKIEPREKVAIKSRVAGQAQRVLVDEGMRVKKGQLLLVLDPIDFQRGVARAEQEVERAKAALEIGQVTLERRQRGLKDRGVSQEDVDLAASEVKTRKIVVKQSLEALATASDQLRFSRIVSPMDGTVTQRSIQPGETVVPGIAATLDDRSLMVVADLSVLIAKVDLNQIDVAKLRLGQPAALTLDALPGKTFRARISKIAPASTLPRGKEVEVFPVEATLEPEGTEAIKPGMTADVKVIVERKTGVLKLPLEAIVADRGKLYAKRVKGDPRGPGKVSVERVEVTVGVRSDREQEIRSGLSAGDQVLIEPPSAEANEWK